MRKRLLMVVGGVYFIAALLGHARERSGSVVCGCSNECWCRRPGPSLFRWVAPFGHRV